MRFFYKFFLILIFINAFSLSAQPFQYYEGKEANNWHFGDSAAITFNTPDGHPVAITNSKLFTIEATASISDKDGKLLYYTNGYQIWNKNHIQNQTLLKSSYTTAQGAMILPFPNRKLLFVSLYGVFDHSLIGYEHNGGGNTADWPTKSGLNIQLYENDKFTTNHDILGTKGSIEGMAAYYDRHQNLYRIVNTTAKSILISYINENGIAIKIDTIQNHSLGITNTVKISPNGQFVVITSILEKNLIQIYKYNNLSSKYEFYSKISSYPNLYGLEISPNSKFLYYVDKNLLQQYNLISSDITTIAINSDFVWSSGQLAPDGRIYIIEKSNDLSLSVIKKPNLKGKQCNFERNEIDLKKRKVLWGLPNFPSHFFSFDNGNIEILAKDTACLNESFTFKPVMNEHVYPIDSIKWVGPNGVFNTTDTILHIDNITFNHRGTYTFTVYSGSYQYSASHEIIYISNVSLLKINYEKKLRICEGDSVILSSNINYVSYSWNTGESSKSIVAKEAGTYTLIVTNSYGCLNMDSVKVEVLPLTKIEFSKSGIICEKIPIELGTKEKFKSYRWSNGDTTEITYISNSGTYYLRATNENACESFDSVKIVISPLPEIAFDVPSILCQGTEVELKTKQKYAKYVWSTGDTTSSIIVSLSGTYKLTVENEIGCQTSKEILLNFAPKIDLQIIGNASFCSGDFAKVKTNLSLSDYDFEWSNGETTNEISVSIGGTYTVKVTSKKTLCTATASIEIKEINSEFAQIEGKRSLCENETTTLTAKPDNMTYLWSNGEISQSLTINKSATYWVLVSSQEGCSDTAFVDVFDSKIEKPELIYQAKICKDAETEITVKQDYDSYLWSNGETTKSIKAKAGKYSLSVRNADNCEAKADFEISNYEAKMSFDRNEIDFSEVALNLSKTETIIITEKTDIEEFTVNSSYFQVSKNNDKIEITFTPNKAKVYEDSLIIEVQKPCYARYAIYIKGTGIDYTLPILVSAPHLEYTPGENLSIPIKLEYKGDSKYLPINTNYEIEVEIARDVLMINETHTVSSNMRKVVFAGNIDISSNELQIATITGLSMLAENEINPIIISKVSFPDTKIIAEKLEGSLKMKDVCAANLRSLSVGVAVFSQIKPNPATNEAELEIQSNHQGNIDIIIYNYDGLEVYRSNINKTNNTQNMKLNLQNISSGKYFYSIKQGKEGISSGSLIIEK